MGILDKFRDQKAGHTTHHQVIEHVCDMLNTKRGYGHFDRKYGLDSYTHSSSQSLVHQVADDIKRCMENYEKRIELIGVEPLDQSSPFSLGFQVKCRIAGNRHIFSISYQKIRREFEFKEGL